MGRPASSFHRFIGQRCVVEIGIEDSGTGIPKGIREKVLDQFFTTKEVGTGTGLGLSIAHSIIVQKHGGIIGFETEEGKGTRFIVRLPIMDPVDRDETAGLGPVDVEQSEQGLCDRVG